MVPPPNQNTLEVCNQINLLIFNYINYRLVTLLKVIDAPTEVRNIFYLTVSFQFLSFSQIFLFLFLKCLLASRLTLFRLLHYLCLDPAFTEFWPVSFDLNNLNILQKITVYAASIRADPDSLWLRF